jgi:hypothetical protein
MWIWFVSEILTYWRILENEAVEGKKKLFSGSFSDTSRTTRQMKACQISNFSGTPITRDVQLGLFIVN